MYCLAKTTVDVPYEPEVPLALIDVDSVAQLPPLALQLQKLPDDIYYDIESIKLWVTGAAFIDSWPEAVRNNQKLCLELERAGYVFFSSDEPIDALLDDADSARCWNLYAELTKSEPCMSFTLRWVGTPSTSHLRHYTVPIPVAAWPPSKTAAKPLKEITRE